MTRFPPAVLRVALVGGPMYDPLYAAMPAFEQEADVRVEIVAQLPHPELNAFVKRAFEDRAMPLDLISTHTKYAPSQAPWLMPLDDLALRRAARRSAAAAGGVFANRRGGCYQVPRNLDIRLLHYRRDLLPAAPQTWAELFDAARAIARPAIDGGPPLLRVSLSRPRLRLVRHVLRVARLRPAANCSTRICGRLRLGGRAVGGRADRRSASPASVTPRELPDWHYDEISASFRAGDAAMVSDWPGSYHLYRRPGDVRRGRSRRARVAAGRASGHPRRLCRLSLVCNSAHAPRTRADCRADRAPDVVRSAARRGPTRRHPVPCKRARRRAARSGRRPGRGAAVGVACRNRADHDHSAAICRVSAMRRCAVAERAAGDEGRVVAAPTPSGTPRQRSRAS